MGTSALNRWATAALFSIASLLVTTTYAADKEASQDSSTPAAEVKSNAVLLAQLSERSKAIQSLEGRFVQQKHIAVLPAPLNSTGRFQFTQGKGVVWEVLTPVQNKVALTPKGISFGDDQSASQAARQAGIEEVAKIFMGVIAGELDTLKDYFAVVASGDSRKWTLRLTPHSANLAAYIKRIELQGGEVTEQLDIFEANGDHTHISFTTDKILFANGKTVSGTVGEAR